MPAAQRRCCCRVTVGLPSPGDAARVTVAHLSVRDTAAVITDVIAPSWRAAIARRPRVLGMLDRLDADRCAIGRLQLLEGRYGPGPVLLCVPRRDVVLLLTSTLLATLLRDGRPRAAPASRLRGATRLPATLSRYRLRFDGAAAALH